MSKVIKLENTGFITEVACGLRYGHFLQVWLQVDQRMKDNSIARIGVNENVNNFESFGQVMVILGTRSC